MADDIGLHILWEHNINPDAIIDKTRMEIRKMLNHRCARARKNIQRSMKNVGKKTKSGKAQKLAGQASPPGTPPYVHDQAKEGLRRLIRYAIIEEPGLMTGYVGYLPGRDMVGLLHEVGGSKAIKNKRRVIRELRGAGEVILNFAQYIRLKGNENIKEVVDQYGIVRPVLYRLNQTVKATQQANRHNERLYGSNILFANYPARPAIRKEAKALGSQLTEETALKLMELLKKH